MSIIKLDFKKLDEKIEKMGVVIDFIPYFIDENINYDFHKLIAIKGMKYLKKKYYEFEIMDKDIVGKKININEFIKTPKDKYKPDNFVTDGYKEAFFNPPYPLSGNTIEQNNLFEIIIKTFFSPFTNENLEIYKWSTDWSSYFKFGKEWWGCYYWTIFNKDKSYLLVVAASSSD